MLSEEALIVLAALGACGLLVFGVLEALWPTRRRQPLRPPPEPPRPARMRRTSAFVRHARPPGQSPYARRPAAASPADPAPAAAAPPPMTALARAGATAGPERPVDDDDGARALPGAAAPAEPGPVGDSDAGPGDGTDLEHRKAEPDGAPATGEPATPAERCLWLHDQGRHAEAIAAATAALAAATAGGDAAAVWSVVALARRAQGDPEAAAGALEAAIAAASPAEQPAYRRQLADLAAAVVRERLAAADRHTAPDSEERLLDLREAIAWAERGLEMVPDDAALAELAAGAEALLWPAWERTVMALAQRQDFRGARRLLREALDDPRFPASRGEAFRGLFSGTFSGEIGQLTAQAIRSVQDAREADALRALQRAESLLRALSDEALSPRRREEVDRRLWWGYRALGERRLAAGECEAALEPLFQALTYDVGPEAQEETRALLLRALDGLTDARALGIQELADAGDREAAIVQCDRLWALLRTAADHGVTQSELGGAYLKVQRLLESLNR